MLDFMLYAVAFAGALGVVALSLEHLAAMRARPRRMHWLLAMLCSVVLPPLVALNARPEPVPAPAAPDRTHVQPMPANADASAFDSKQLIPFLPEAPPAPPPASRLWRVPEPARGTLLLAWAAVSGTLLLLLAGAGLTLRRRASRWRRAWIGDLEVLVSKHTGPALIGALRPRIVVPQWFMDEPADTQSLILQHEQQHVVARDPLLLRAALLLALATPWNLPLWWQLHRLRLAIELDCDARVMRSGAEPARYGQVLLGVTRRATRMPVGAIAMSEPVSALEQRIRSLMPVAGRCARLRMIGVSLIAAAGVGAAAALEAPALGAPQATRAATGPTDTASKDATSAPMQATSPHDRPMIDGQVNPDFGKPECRFTRDGTPANDTNCNPLDASGNSLQTLANAGLLERMNVVTGGAAATYGSGAMAGVVNLVLNNRLNAIKLDMEEGARPTPEMDPAVRAAMVRQRIKELEQKLEELRQRFNDKHPEIIAHKMVLDDLRAQEAGRPWARPASHPVALRALINEMSEQWGWRFVLDPRVQGSVDLGNLNPNDPDSLTYHAFLEILGVHGFVAVRSDDVVTIVPGEYARSIATPTIRLDPREFVYMGDDAEVVTALIPVGTRDAGQLNPHLLAPLVSPWGYLTETPDGKSLLMVDKVANVKRIAELAWGRTGKD